MRTLRPILAMFIAALMLGACAVDTDDDGGGPDRAPTDAVAADTDEADAPGTDVAADTAVEADAPVDSAAPDGADDTTDDAQPDTVADAADDTADTASDVADDGSDATGDAADGGDATADSGADTPVGPCIGSDAIVPVDAPEIGELVADPTAPGSMHPNWRLMDFQPQSCGFGQTYGLDAFRGQTLVVVLLSAGCSYCLGQTIKLEQMRYQLEVEGHDVHFAVVNLKTMADRQDSLVERGSFPLFQDTAEVDAWGLHEGRKDDFYIYDADGVLQTFLPASGEIPTNLSTDEGYANLHDAIVAVVEGR